MDAVYTEAIAFSGGGFNGTYHLGCAQYIFERRERFRNVCFGGISAGSFVATLLCCDIEPSKFYERVYRSHILPWKIATHAESVLLDMLPEDAAERCSGRLFVHLTRPGHLTPWTVTRFRDKEDIAACCRASSSVPFLTDGLFVTYRGQSVVDGGLCGRFNRPPPVDIPTTFVDCNNVQTDAHVRCKRTSPIRMFLHFGRDALDDLFRQGYADFEDHTRRKKKEEAAHT